MGKRTQRLDKSIWGAATGYGQEALTDLHMFVCLIVLYAHFIKKESETMYKLTPAQYVYMRRTHKLTIVICSDEYVFVKMEG